MAAACYLSYKVFYYVSSLNTISTVIAIGFGCLAYFTAMALIGGLKKEDLELIPMGRKIIKILKRRGFL